MAYGISRRIVRCRPKLEWLLTLILLQAGGRGHAQDLTLELVEEPSQYWEDDHNSVVAEERVHLG